MRRQPTRLMVQVPCLLLALSCWSCVEENNILDGDPVYEGGGVYDLDPKAPLITQETYTPNIETFAVLGMNLAAPNERPLYLNHPYTFDFEVEVSAEPFETGLWYGLKNEDGDYCVLGNVELQHVLEAFEQSDRANFAISQRINNSFEQPSMEDCAESRSCSNENEECLSFILPAQVTNAPQWHCSTQDTAIQQERSAQTDTNNLITPADITGSVDDVLIVKHTDVIPESCAPLVDSNNLSLWASFDPERATQLAGREDLEEPDFADLDPVDINNEGPREDSEDAESPENGREMQDAARLNRYFAERLEIEADVDFNLEPDPGLNVSILDAELPSSVVEVHQQEGISSDIELTANFQISGTPLPIQEDGLLDEVATFNFTMRPVGDLKASCAAMPNAPEAQDTELLVLHEEKLSDGTVYQQFLPGFPVKNSTLGVSHSHTFNLRMTRETLDSVLFGELSCWAQFEVKTCISNTLSEITMDGLGDEDNCTTVPFSFERTFVERTGESTTGNFDMDINELPDDPEEIYEEAAGFAADYGQCDDGLIREYAELLKQQREAEDQGRFSKYFAIPADEFAYQFPKRLYLFGYKGYKQNYHLRRKRGSCTPKVHLSGRSREEFHGTGTQVQRCFRKMSAHPRKFDSYHDFPDCTSPPAHVYREWSWLRTKAERDRCWFGWHDDPEYGLMNQLRHWAPRLTNDPAGATEELWQGICHRGRLSQNLCRFEGSEYNDAWALLMSTAASDHPGFHEQSHHANRWKNGSRVQRQAQEIMNQFGNLRYCRAMVLAPAVAYTVDHNARLRLNYSKHEAGRRMREFVLPNLCHAQRLRDRAQEKWRQIQRQCYSVSKPFNPVDGVDAAGRGGNHGAVKYGRLRPDFYKSWSHTVGGIRAHAEGGLLNDFELVTRDRQKGQFSFTFGPQIRIHSDVYGGVVGVKDFRFKDIFRAKALGVFYSNGVDSHFVGDFHVLTHNIWHVEFKLQEEIPLPSPPPLSKSKEKCKYIPIKGTPFRVMLCAGVGGEVGLALRLEVEGLGTEIQGGDEPGIFGSATPYLKITASGTAGLDAYIGNAGLRLNIDPLLDIKFPIRVGAHWDMRADADYLTWTLKPQLDIKRTVDVFGGNLEAFVDLKFPSYTLSYELFQWDPYAVDNTPLHESRATIGPFRIAY